MYFERAKQIFKEEIAEFRKLSEHIDESFDAVVDVLYNCKGHVVVMGIGKSGIIAHKFASSLASTGTPSFFVNAAEAVHGDLGMINSSDVAVLVSNSGATSEVLNVILPLRNIGCVVVALTGDRRSQLAREADLVLSVHVDHESCPLGLAPTTSTTAALLMTDALVVCLMERRKFNAENFAVYHPGGALGRQLLGRIVNRMTTNVPRVAKDDSFKQVVVEMSDKHLGMTMVYEDATYSKCVGIITDGDLRRAVLHHDDALSLNAAQIMTAGFKSIHQKALLSDALAIMDKYNITTLAVTETKTSTDIIGIISIHHIIDFN